MTARDIFYLDGRRLRAPWRLALFVAVLLVCASVTMGLVPALVTAPFARIGAPPETAFWWGALLALVLAHLVMVRLVDRDDWSAVWLDRAAARPRPLLVGALVGILAIGVPSLVLLAVGWLDVREAPDGSWLHAALVALLLLLPAALAEELLVRGYAFRVLWDAIGWPATLLLTSLAFGLLHLSNPSVSARSIALVTLAGIFLGGFVVAMRSLYAAWLAHFTWNFTLAALLHSAVSGAGLATPDYTVVDAGPDWATGGGWGPEGGVGAGIGMLAALWYLFARHRAAPVSAAAGTASHAAPPDTHDTIARPERREEPYA